MSVLIKDIEMPPEGLQETVLLTHNKATVNSTRAWKGYKEFEAVSVPPHGRLIDADDFIKRMTGLMQKAEEDDFALGAAWYETFIRHIELAPTVIPEDEVV